MLYTVFSLASAVCTLLVLCTTVVNKEVLGSTDSRLVAWVFFLLEAVVGYCFIDMTQTGDGFWFVLCLTMYMGLYRLAVGFYVLEKDSRQSYAVPATPLLTWGCVFLGSMGIGIPFEQSAKNAVAAWLLVRVLHTVFATIRRFTCRADKCNL